MMIDFETLVDLGIFQRGGNLGEIFKLINHTKSTLGKSKLLNHLKYPPKGIHNVVKMQEKVHGAGAVQDMLKEMILDLDLDMLIDYRDLQLSPEKVTASRLRFFHLGLLRLRFPSFVVEISRHLSNFLNCRSVLKHFIARIEDFDDVWLTDIRGRGEQLLEAIAKIVPINTSKLSDLEAIYVDGLLRGECKGILRDFIEYVSDLEVIYSLCAANSRNHWVMPKVYDGNELVLKDVRHPLVLNCVPSDLLINNSKILIFTGPNMAGKTTFISACGLCIYFAHLGLGVPCTSGKVPYYDFYYSCYFTETNISSGMSLFYGELVKLANFLKSVERQDKFFMLLDEPFQGTNTEDANGCLSKLCSILNSYHGVHAFISTHLHEAVERLSDQSLADCYFFEASISGNSLSLDYKVRKGISKQKLGVFLFDQLIETSYNHK